MSSVSRRKGACRGASRRDLYRRGKRVLGALLRRTWIGARDGAEHTVRRFLRDRSRGFLVRLVGDRAFAAAVAASLLAAGAARSEPPVNLSAVAGGNGGFVINGIDPNDVSGFSVSGAGDVNGDGLADLIVGARGADPGGDGSAGESYVVFGKADGAPVNLSAIAGGSGGFVINGIDAIDSSGQSVSGAGDVNGDGLADLVVGAPQGDPGGDSNAGESYVVFGKADGAAVNLADVAAGNGGFVINGIDADDFSGSSVSGAGDVNGDGLADLVVGAAEGDPGGDSNAGESYVVFGKANGAAVNLADVAGGSGGFVINGIDIADRSGYSVSGAGDVNGDGLADLVVGAPQGDPGGVTSAGESYVVFGKADGAAVSLSVVALGGGGFVINGIADIDSSGQSVSGAGDVNGDGLADLVVGAQHADPGGDSNAGESYVVFGKANGAAVNLADVAGGSGGFVINGIDTLDYSGVSVSGAGDVNGDGLADLVVAARLADPGGVTSAGESYVVFGKADGAAVSLSVVALGGGGFVINGIADNDRSGFSVSGAGDVNGDGLADLVVGAPYANPGGDSNAGESYVVFSAVAIVGNCRRCDGPVETCTIQTKADCLAHGGLFLGLNSDCGTNASSQPGAVIPDNDATGVSDTITVAPAFVIGDVDVTLTINHFFVGDLCVTLEHGGTEVELIVRPGQADDSCSPGGPCCGCAADGYVAIVLDDVGAGGAIEDQCATKLSSPPGYVPNSPLSAFNGQSSDGVWTLTVRDSDPGAEGSLVSWSLDLKRPAGPWANVVLGFSSQYSWTGWSAKQALGPPNTMEYGDIESAWSPSVANGTQEFLTLGFGEPLRASGVTVRETWGNGFVNRIDVVQMTGQLSNVWVGNDPTLPGAPGEFVVTWAATPLPVKGVKIGVNTDLNQEVWEEIDAVRLHGIGQDCNANGAPDECDVASGASLDLNQDGVPDECTCPWDCGGTTPNGVINTVDFLALLQQWGTTGGSCDLGNNGVTTTDFLALLQHWGPCP